MSRKIVPSGMPRGIADVTDAISSALRTEVLHRLSSGGPRSAVELAQEIEVDHAVVHRHLVALEAAGLARRDHLHPARRGRTKVLWSSDPANIRVVAGVWLDYALGKREE